MYFDYQSKTTLTPAGIMKKMFFPSSSKKALTATKNDAVNIFRSFAHTLPYKFNFPLFPSVFTFLLLAFSISTFSPGMTLADW